MTELKEWIAEADENRRLLAQEYLIATVAQQIWSVMERDGLTKAQLAEALGKSRPFVSQVLSGAANLTLRTISDIAQALGCEIDLQLRKQDGDGWEDVLVDNRTKVVQFLRPDISCNQSEWTTLTGTTLIAETEAA